MRIAFPFLPCWAASSFTYCKRRNDQASGQLLQHPEWMSYLDWWRVALFPRYPAANTLIQWEKRVKLNCVYICLHLLSARTQVQDTVSANTAFTGPLESLDIGTKLEENRVREQISRISI